MPNTRRADLLHRPVDDVSLHLDALDLLDDMDLSTLTDNLQIEELQIEELQIEVMSTDEM